MGELRNCPACGKIFVKVSRNLCPECIEKEEDEFEAVRDFIKNSHDEPTVEEICEGVDVDEKKVLRWMREGRIEYNLHGVSKGITCKRCGVEINIGEFCPNCIRLMVNQLNATAKEPRNKPAPPPEKPKTDAKSEGMFVANRLRNEQ